MKKVKKRGNVMLRKVYRIMVGGRMRTREALIGYLFIIPVLAHLLIFTYFGIIYSGILSLYQGTLLSPFKNFIGLYNYPFLLHHEYFLQGLYNTLLFCGGVVPIGTGIGLFFALLINQKLAGRTFFRVMWYAPVVTSIVATVNVWLWMYNVDYGLFNSILTRIGLPKLEWIYSTKTALMSVMVVYLWQSIPFNMIIYLAALQTVPAQLYEAAQVDGASSWKQFYKITLPMIMPTTYFIIIVSTINSLNVFTQVYLMTGGGPVNSTTMVGYQIYEAAFEFNMWGRGSAIAVLFFFLVLCFSFIQYRCIPESYV